MGDLMPSVLSASMSILATQLLHAQNLPGDQSSCSWAMIRPTGCRSKLTYAAACADSQVHFWSGHLEEQNDGSST